MKFYFKYFLVFINVLSFGNNFLPRNENQLRSKEIHDFIKNPKNDEIVIDMFFVTVCDMEHYPFMNGLIKSIRTYSGNNFKELAVFDLGLTDMQKNELSKINGVRVCKIEPVNPDIFTKFIVRKNGRLARGWYSWKPVVLKQALELYPYFLYIDTNKRITRSLDKIFLYIKNHGYLFRSGGESIRSLCTQYVFEKFGLQLPKNKGIANHLSIEAGVQGISRAIYGSYVLPMYTLARDLRNFEDNGTAPGGFGECRHDQTLASIVILLSGLTMEPLNSFYYSFVLRANLSENPNARMYRLIG